MHIVIICLPPCIWRSALCAARPVRHAPPRRFRGIHIPEQSVSCDRQRGAVYRLLRVPEQEVKDGDRLFGIAHRQHLFPCLYGRLSLYFIFSRTIASASKPSCPNQSRILIRQSAISTAIPSGLPNPIHLSS